MPEDCVKPADTLQSLDGGKNAVNQMEQQDVTHKMQNITFAQAGKPCDLHEALKADKMGGDKPRDCEIEDARSDLPAQNTDGQDSVLPQRHLRVLLVEDDDSTRHVVGALLRNCSYAGMALSLPFLLFYLQIHVIVLESCCRPPTLDSWIRCL